MKGSINTFLVVVCLSLLPIISVEGGALLRRSSNSNNTTIVMTRELQSTVRDFQPLSCNANLGSATCTTWSTLIGKASSYTNRVTIPCGRCVIMDYSGTSLQLLGGLEIIGKLVFPNKYKLQLSTTTIIVQGELLMTSSKPVNGIPDVTITMTGNSNDVTFTPIDRNSNACNGASTCTVGKKAIVVAGGKINVRGIPSGTPTWTRIYDVAGGTFNSPTTILVSSAVNGRWAVGAQLLITSHTREWNGHQERTITRVSTSNVNGYVAITLNAPIIRPTTILESPDYAVEVALLSRNILFVGGSDTTARHGGHLMIMNTPSVIQSIVGIEVRNFGQQGYLGKYPIHFHFCKDVSGSVVSSNTIRQSNQRCVVVHGTNKLRINDNVAFDTKGHCYMTEDGIETGNEFIRNLGALTGAPDTLIPNMGANGIETDNEPSTFWITSPTNSWVGNVAAGSIHSGFWFEPKLRGERASLFPGKDPQLDPIITFKDNVGHSNMGSVGALRMYKPGYTPTTTAIFEGLRFYRNAATGIFVHRSSNIIITNAHFADNDIGIDLDRTEGIEVRNTVVIGESNSYRALMSRQTVNRVCRDNQDRWLIGIDLHTWKKEKSIAGATLSNITLSGYKNVRCPSAASIHYDDHTLKQGIFEFYTSFKNVKNADGPESINFCAVNQGIKMMYFIDLDGTLRPSTVSTQGPSTLLGNNNRQLVNFVDAAKCTDVAVGCYSYCANTCFRSMRYEPVISGKTNPMLKVCRRDNRSICSLFPGGQRGSEPLTFMAHLPVGNLYDAVFVDGQGIEFAASSVLEEVEPSLCPTGGIFEVKLYASLP